MTSHATMLTPPFNFAVVQMPDRNYPGVVFQGDTLHSMTTQVAQMQRLLAKQDLAELGDEIEVLLHDLLAIQASYERVCSEQGIDLPYVR
ncbi:MULTISPECIES: hypothetical protein [unclassified Rhizobium]|uniref:DUF6959 family protein n=1 Tax=unclassified Rhizobium TaxID=2613769 RepID=UPI001AE8B160|nr:MULTISPECIES: hypothetical protein [unclassified Rhizobium]MBP2461465.1 hypothetical protein [Rhizobium sp. PvP014]MBP2528861.1 hypothetical protein [Rhizobium sp. PvP099]